MSYDLRITFTGLILLAPDPDEQDPANARLHAFFPNMNVAGGHDMPHFARLVYDSAHREQGATQFTRHLVCRELEGRELLFPDHSDQGLDLTLSKEIADFDAQFGPGWLSRRLLDADPRPHLTSRLSLAAGVMTDCKLGAYFAYPEQDAQRMTWQVEWTLRGVPGDRLELQSRSFDAPGEAPTQVDTLFPIGQTIRLGIHHVPEESLPPLPLPEALLDSGDPHHIVGYYLLQDRRSLAEVPIPTRLEGVVIETGGCHAPVSPPDSPPVDDANIGAETTNCVVGTGTLEERAPGEV